MWIIEEWKDTCTPEWLVNQGGKETERYNGTRQEHPISIITPRSLAPPGSCNDHRPLLSIVRSKKNKGILCSPSLKRNIPGASTLPHSQKENVGIENKDKAGLGGNLLNKESISRKKGKKEGGTFLTDTPGCGHLVNMVWFHRRQVLLPSLFSTEEAGIKSLSTALAQSRSAPAHPPEQVGRGQGAEEGWGRWGSPESPTCSTSLLLGPT